MCMWDKVLKGLCAAAGAIAGIFGEWTTLLSILLIAMVVDYVSGLLVAVVGKSPKTEAGGLSSNVGFIGLAKKGFIMLVVLVATLLDRAIGNTSMVFQSAATCYYIANECLSVLENAVLIGLPVPQVVKNALEEMREKNDRHDEEDVESSMK